MTISMTIPMAQKLTNIQERILETIRESWVDRGYAPTLQEISDGAMLSRSTAWLRLAHLEEAGLVAREPRSPRSVRLTDAGAKAIAASSYGYAAKHSPSAYELTEMIRHIVREEIERQTAGKDKL